MLAGAAKLYHAAHMRSVSPAWFAPLQAKLPRNSSQIARGRIRRFESYMPSQPVPSPADSGAGLRSSRSAERTAVGRRRARGRRGALGHLERGVRRNRCAAALGAFHAGRPDASLFAVFRGSRTLRPPAAPATANGLSRSARNIASCMGASRIFTFPHD
jgi:hypothetical protein